MRSWLPEAEAELKFHSIPEDEDSIMQQIENHEVGYTADNNIIVIINASITSTQVSPAVY